MHISKQNIYQKKIQAAVLQETDLQKPHYFIYVTKKCKILIKLNFPDRNQ